MNGDLVFERFTDRARRVVTLAQDEARRLGHDGVDGEHLLLGLINENEGVGATALKQLGFNSDMLRDYVITVSPPSSHRVVGHIPFSDRGKKIVELSLREALQLGHNYIGTEHILLAILREGESKAAVVLVNAGADLSHMRHTVIRLLCGYQSPPQPSVKIEFSSEAVHRTLAWLQRIEDTFGPLAEQHPAKLLRIELQASQSQ